MFRTSTHDFQTQTRPKPPRGFGAHEGPEIFGATILDRFQGDFAPKRFGKGSSYHLYPFKKTTTLLKNIPFRIGFDGPLSFL